jgi:uncharacterized protein (TIGR02001 family)
MIEKHRLRSSLAAFAVAATFAGTAWSQTPAPQPDWSFSGNVGLFSQYVFRGIAQTNEKPALQGGFDLGHKSGFYVGTWASNVSWLSDGNPDVSASLEWDFYGGYKLSLPHDFGADFGVLYYWYPGTYPSGYTKPNTTELYAALSWKMLSAKYSYSVSDTFGFADSDGSYYVEGNLNWDVVDKVNDYIGKVTLIGHVGYQSYRNNSDYSYTDWKGGVSTDFMGVTVGFAVTGTDADGALYTNRFGKDTSDTQYIVWVQKSF